MKNVRNEIDEYLALWDQAQKSFPKEKKTPRPDSSFFGLQNHGNTQDITEDEEEHWRDIYYRSLEIDPDEIRGDGDENLLSEEEIDQQCLAGMMNLREAREAKKKIAEKKASKGKPAKKSSKKKKSNSKKPKDTEEVPEWDDEDGFGRDLANGPGEDVDFTPNPVHFASVGVDSKLRVTPNFTDGKELRKLAKCKELLYAIESELLGTDIRGGNITALQSELRKIRKQCEKLSQKLIPDPKFDVT